MAARLTAIKKGSVFDEFDDDDGECLDCCCRLLECLSKSCTMRLASIRSLILLFFFLSLILMFTMILTSDTMNRRVNCDTGPWNLGPMVNSAESLTLEHFTDEYISLSDKVEMLGPGERLVDSFFNYLSKKIKPKTKKKILIAVVTTEKYLLTRAQAIHDTWAQDMGFNNQLYFFVGEDCDISHHGLQHLPIIKVSGVRDNVYPPQEKVFSVLAYIYQRFGEEYRWFIRADDDVYIRVQEVETMLDALDWREKMYIGHPGYGKDKDRKRLKLLPHENYCMGGPGVVFSGAALQALTVHLKRCLKAIASYNSKWGQDIGWYNEDVELGRCISRTIGINCVPPKVKWSPPLVMMAVLIQ